MSNMLRTVIISLTILGFIGCGGGGGGSDGSAEASTSTQTEPTQSKTSYRVTVVDGYIKDATVTDEKGNVAKQVDGEKGIYEFDDTPSGYINVRGGSFTSGLKNTIEMRVKSDTKIISPLTSFGYKNSQKIDTLKKVLNTPSLDIDYVSTNNITLAKMSQILYVLSANGLDDKFASSTSSSNTTFASLIDMAKNSALGSSDQDDIIVFIDTTNKLSQTTKVNNLENILSVLKNNATTEGSQEGTSSEDTKNKAPIANAGTDQTKQINTPVSLNASASSDSDGSIVKYEWFEKDILLGSGKIYTTSSLEVEIHTITLKVTDNDGATSSDDVIITITEKDEDKVVVQSIVFKTGQTKSYDQNGNEVTDGSVKDDGYYKKGVAKSFAKGESIVIDNITGLQWQNNEDVKAKRDSWDEAKKYCENLELSTYSDWRLPTKKELDSRLDFGGSGIFGIVDSLFLTQSKYGREDVWSNEIDADDDSTTWAGSLYEIIDKDDKGYYSTRCVRAGKTGVFNTTCTRNENETVSCNNGLVWQDNTEASTTKKIWIEAINYCENLNFAGHNDWRLPNFNELLSLVNYSEYRSIDPAFKNISWEPKFQGQKYNYWSSTSSNSNEAYRVGFDASASNSKYKGTVLNVRCVRAGQ